MRTQEQYLLQVGVVPPLTHPGVVAVAAGLALIHKWCEPNLLPCPFRSIENPCPGRTISGAVGTAVVVTKKNELGPSRVECELPPRSQRSIWHCNPAATLKLEHRRRTPAVAVAVHRDHAFEVSVVSARLGQKKITAARVHLQPLIPRPHRN